jgi:hypothetical protein
LKFPTQIRSIEVKLRHCLVKFGDIFPNLHCTVLSKQRVPLVSR